VSGLGKLIADVPPGHPYFTTRSGAGLDRVSWPEAARWLVHTQAYDISGIKSGAVGDPRVKGGRGYPIGTGWAGAIGGLLVEGETLWETLLLNLIPQDSPEARFGAQDRPAWEAAPTTPEESDDVAARPFGPLDLYTWQSRRILLHGDDNGVTGVVLTNGDKITPQNRFPQEPMTAWRLSEAQMKAMGTKNPVYMPLAHLPERALWRGLESILPQAAPRGGSRDGERRLAPGALVWAGSAIEKNRRLRVRAIGMTYGTQNAVVTDIVEDRLALSAVLLSTDRPGLIDMVTATVRATEEAVRATGNLAADLVQAAGGTDERLVTGARSRAAERCYAGIDGPFRRWLASLGPETDSDEARTAWYATARRTIASVADALVAEASPTAWTGRTVGGRHLSTPEADGRYRYALAKALPRPEPATTDTPAPTTVGGIR
jgi:CRISPR system Cascade subunit CasA